MRNLNPNSQNENQENREEEGPCSPLPFLPPPSFTEQFNSDEEQQQEEMDHNNENILNHTNRIKQVPINGENKNQNWFDETKILISDRFEQLKKQCEEAFGTKKFKEGLVASQILKEKYSRNQQQMQNQQEQQQQQPEISSSQQKAYLRHIAQLSSIQQENSSLFVDVPLKGKTVTISKAVAVHYTNYFKQKLDERNSDLSQNVAIEQTQQQQQEQMQQQQMPDLKENNPKSKRKQNSDKKKQKYTEEEHIVFSEQIKTIMEQLKYLDDTEKRRATLIQEAEFYQQIQNMVDCVGCKESLQIFITNLSQQAQQANKSIRLDGITISGNKEIGVIDSLLESNFTIASFLQFHQNKAAVLEDLNKTFCIFKKSLSQHNYRCQLHSKKPIPFLWKDNCEQLLEADTWVADEEETLDIEESVFLLNLDKYLKKRKFCVTCKENILGEYSKLKDKVENCEISEDMPCCEEHEEMAFKRRLAQQDQTKMEENEHYTNVKKDNQAIESKCSKNHSSPADCPNEERLSAQEEKEMDCHVEMNEDGKGEQHLRQQDDDNGCYEDELEDDDEEEEEEEEDEEDGMEDAQYDLINHIKYCNKTQKISIPMQIGFIREILDKAQIDTSLVKHADTAEAAQDELLICLGQTLKDKLQTVWKNKKSEEIVRQIFLNTCFKIFLAQIQGFIQMAMQRQGCKNSLEEYLEEDERVKEAKKAKNQKKKLKQKAKKEEKRQEEQTRHEEEELKNKELEETQKKIHADNKKKQKNSNNISEKAILSNTVNTSVTPIKKQNDSKQQQKLNQNTQETITNSKIGMKPVKSLTDNSITENDALENEKYLLKKMGWDENEQFDSQISGISEKEIQEYYLNKSKLDKERASYRRNLKQRFQCFILSNHNNQNK